MRMGAAEAQGPAVRCPFTTRAAALARQSGSNGMQAARSWGQCARGRHGGIAALRSVPFRRCVAAGPGCARHAWCQGRRQTVKLRAMCAVC